MAGSVEGKFSAFTEIGDSGVKRYGGYITEEFLAQLRGVKAMQYYREMYDNHPVIGGISFAIQGLFSQVDWNVEPASDSPEDVADADFVNECLNDMSMTWNEVVQEIITFMWFGYSIHEICYGPRNGKYLKIDGEDTGWKSRYSDGKIGWRKISLRAQDTFYKWHLTKAGDVLAWEQQRPDGGGNCIIPREKFLHFRMAGAKGNPEGKSVLRNAAVSFYNQKNVQSIESIGVERDLAGLPVGYVPQAYLSEKATKDQQAIVSRFENMLGKIRQNENSYIMMPSVYDDKGNRMFDVKLMTTGGTRAFDTNSIVTRYDQRIALVVLADFMLLGSQSVGSFALSSDKTKLFAAALGGVLDQICEVFSRHAIPRLLEVNGRPTDKTPRLTHSDIESVNLQELSSYISSLSAAGMPLFPDPVLEEKLRDLADLPAPLETATRDVGGGSAEDTGDLTEGLTPEGQQTPEENTPPAEAGDSPPAEEQ